MIIFHILLFAFLVVNSVNAKPQYSSLIVSKVVNVYDGDTFRSNIDDIHPLLGQNIAIRVNGVGYT